MTAVLTIAIPTFDNNALVAKYVAVLAGQLTGRCRLLVLDNASPAPVAPGLPAHDGIRVVRHPWNIGAAANILRCIELCETPWLWILGDDDPPKADAVQTALAEIDRAEDRLLINFACLPPIPTAERDTDGLAEFVAGIGDFANLTLISNNVMRADRLAPYLRLGHYHTYGLFVHLAVWLLALNAESGRCRFSPRQLVEWGPESQWSRVLAAAGVGTLLDLPIPQPVRRRLAPHLVGVSGNYSSLIIALLNQVDVSMDAATARHLFRQAWFRLYRHHRWMPHAAVRTVGTAMLTAPRTAKAVYRWYRRLRGNPVDGQVLDELRRM